MSESIKKVVSYIRFSTVQNAQSDSPDYHRVRIKEYCKFKGWEIINFYEDLAYSGGDNTRPAYLRLKQDIQNNEFDAIVVSKLDRLGRSTKELLEFAELCKENKVHIISLAETIDTSTPQGYFFFTITSAFAQLERETTSIRVKASVPIRAKQGRSLGGLAIYGYKWEPIPGDENHQRLVPVPEEAYVRRLIYDLYCKLRRVRTVARILNEKGYRTRATKSKPSHPFSDSTVRRLIEDPTAKGKRRANYTCSKGKGKSWGLKPIDEWVTVEVQPIVDEKTWEKANAILAENRRGNITKPRSYLLSGLVYCGICGGKMYGHPGGGRAYPKYRCGKCYHKIRTEELDNIIIQELNDHLLKPDHIKQFMQKFPTLTNEEIKETENLLRQAEQEFLSIDRKIDKLIEDWVDEKIKDEESVNRQIKKLRTKQKQLKEEIPRLEGKLTNLIIQKNSEEFILEQSKKFTEMFPILNENEKKTIIERLIDKITVEEDTIDYNMYFLPEFHKNLSFSLVGNSHHNYRGSLLPQA